MKLLAFLARVNKCYTVLEHSEIDEKKRVAVNSKGELLYNATHLVINNFSLKFVKEFCSTNIRQLPVHIAKRNFNSFLNGEMTSIPCIKLELFAFDIFQYATSLHAIEMRRDEEFSPLKNSDQTGRDCPSTCKEHLSNLHKSFITRSGGKLEGSGYCEISPLISYTGEGLESFVKNKTFQLPFQL